MAIITEERDNKFKRVAAQRQRMTVILENVHDPHNIGAVMRTCDAVGINEVFILYTEDHLDEKRITNFKGSSTGVKKWVNTHLYRSAEECFTHVRSSYDKIYATHLGKEYKSIYESDFTGNVAFLFGNEHDGCSEESLSYTDGNIIIPQYGMVQSLNISVACAVTLYEASRQRLSKGLYDDSIEEAEDWNKDIYKQYVNIHEERYFRKKSRNGY